MRRGHKDALAGSRLSAAAALAALVAMIVAAPAQATNIKCGVPITADNATLTKDLSCPGDGIVVGGDRRQRILLGGHTISGSGSGVGIKFNGHSAGVFGGHAVVQNFDTGIVMDSTSSFVGSTRVEFPANDGVVMSSKTTPSHADLSGVTVSNAGANGIDVFGAGDGKGGTGLVPTHALLSDVDVFSSATNGISVEADTRTEIDSSASKQNGADGIVVAGPLETADHINIHDSRASYNVGWGIAGKRGVRSVNNKAVGNGQLRQCLIVECN